MLPVLRFQKWGQMFTLGVSPAFAALFEALTSFLGPESSSSIRLSPGVGTGSNEASDGDDPAEP